jgi:hypothetical protein
MLSPHIYTALVQERHQAFLAQAETDRRRRRVRLHRKRRGAGAAATGSVRAGLARRKPGALEYEITLGPAE